MSAVAVPQDQTGAPVEPITLTSAIIRLQRTSRTRLVRSLFHGSVIVSSKKLGDSSSRLVTFCFYWRWTKCCLGSSTARSFENATGIVSERITVGRQRARCDCHANVSIKRPIRGKAIAATTRSVDRLAAAATASRRIASCSRPPYASTSSATV